METPKHSRLRFVSWNTMGIRFTEEKSPKLPLVLDELKDLKADVVFLQETHIGPQSYEVLEDISGWRSYFTVHHPRSKGVAILINDKTIFRHICHDEDHSGGYIVLFCRIACQLFTLVNVYNHEKDRHVLKRLADYLRAIDTKGVLVVGGDFNTVLDPMIDRRSETEKTYHSSLRGVLEEFTESLSLTDIFASKHPMEEGFTRSQNQSQSRLDMFFMPTNTVTCVIDCENRGEEKRISDHDPLVLDIKVSLVSALAVPEVSSMLHEFGFSGTPDRSAGEINGAEILSAIRSLPDTEEQTPDNLTVCDYKKNDLPMTEILKINYNMMLKSKCVDECFVKSLPASDGTHSFNVDYLILAHILAKRLKMLLVTEKKSQPNTSDCYTVAFLEKKPKQIRWTFLKNCLPVLYQTCRSNTNIQDVNILEALVHGVVGLTEESSILERILPKSSNPSDDLRELQEGCPLTKAILSLVLKYLEIRINEKGYTTNICYYRQVIVIHRKDAETSPENQRLCREFSKDSGIIMMYI